MDSKNLLTYLQRRELGYVGSRKHVNDMFMRQFRYHDINRPLNQICCNLCRRAIYLGETFACKFSRNKNNLNIFGCSIGYGDLIIGNAANKPYSYVRNDLQDKAILDFAWAEPQMKLVAVGNDLMTKLVDVKPTGTLTYLSVCINDVPVKSVMFCPGSSDVFCGGCQDGSIKIWDTRTANSAVKCNCFIPNAHDVHHPVSNNHQEPIFGITSVIFKTDTTVFSCSPYDPNIKVWDLRRSHCQIKGNTKSLLLTKYYHNAHNPKTVFGYTDMITNPQSTCLYASGKNNIIYCYSIESPEPIYQYSGHHHGTVHSKISISNDGRYLFSGCTRNKGVIWLTDLPYKEKPFFRVSSNHYNTLEHDRQELNCSDWCADSSSLKLAACAYRLPKMFTIMPIRDISQSKFVKTSTYESRSFPKYFTSPIKPELKKNYLKETEKSMELWDSS